VDVDSSDGGNAKTFNIATFSTETLSSIQSSIQQVYTAMKEVLFDLIKKSSNNERLTFLREFNDNINLSGSNCSPLSPTVNVDYSEDEDYGDDDVGMNESEEENEDENMDVGDRESEQDSDNSTCSSDEGNKNKRKRKSKEEKEKEKEKKKNKDEKEKDKVYIYHMYLLFYDTSVKVKTDC
jgi:cobalamin biosynthesis protein CobT